MQSGSSDRNALHLEYNSGILQRLRRLNLHKIGQVKTKGQKKKKRDQNKRRVTKKKNEKWRDRGRVYVNAAELKSVRILPAACDEGASDEVERSEPQSQG